MRLTGTPNVSADGVMQGLDGLGENRRRARRREGPNGDVTMRLDQATVCLPVVNRAVSHAFYTALGFATTGELEEDGMPEPLRFEISDGMRLMLIPRTGFGWVIGGRKRAHKDTHECLIAIGLATEAEVDDLMGRAQAAGADIVMEAGHQQWGYAGTFADPDGHVWQVGLAAGVLTR